MSILRKLLSVLVVNAAVLMIILSFMAWVFDTKLLNATQLTQSMDKNGVAKAIAEAIPAMTVPDKEERGPDGQPLPIDPVEKAKVEATIREVVDEPYVRTKINGTVSSVIGFIKTGKPEPTIDLTDFATRIESSTGEIPKELQEKLGEPIRLNDDKNQKMFTSVRESYNLLSMFKIIGPIIAAILLLIEWFLTPKGKRLGKTAIVFISAGAWGLLWWLFISRAPDIIVTKVKAGEGNEQTMISVVTAVLKSLSTLLSASFLQFSLGCFVIAGLLLLARFIGSKMKASQAAAAQPVPVANRNAQSNLKK